MDKLLKTKEVMEDRDIKLSLPNIVQKNETEFKMTSFFGLQENFDIINLELIQLKNNLLNPSPSIAGTNIFQSSIEHIFEVQEQIEKKLAEFKQARLDNDKLLLEQIFDTQEDFENILSQLKKENQDIEEILIDQLLKTQEELDLKNNDASTLNKKIKELEDENKSYIELDTKIDAKKNKKINDENNIEIKFLNLQGEYDKLKKIIENLKTELDGKRELEASNESMLLHLLNIQEELETHYFKNEVLLKENNLYKARWSRLEEKIPNYFDPGILDLISYDSGSVDQQAVWRLSDYFGGGYSFSEIIFKTVFQDGLLGLAVCESLQDTSKPAFYPSLVDKDDSQTLIFNSLKTTEWYKLLSIANAIEQLTNNKWRDFIVKFDFDTAFYNSAFIKISKVIKALPSILRFDRIKIKRELQNGDYEHLWLDLFGVSYKDIYKKKFEVRIGAANVSASKMFSRFPKFEFPLIDGKDKPFDSWFSEASDDFGQKFELRFALDRLSFDLNVWSKLSVFDQDFLFQIITKTPNILQNLQNEKISINRDWIDWIELSKETASMLISVKELTLRLEQQKVAGLKTQTAKSPGVTSNSRIKTDDNLTPVSLHDTKADASNRVKNKDQIKTAIPSKSVGARKEITIAPKKKLLS